MQKFREELSGFFARLYVAEQKVLVYGEGNPHARMMLVGEAPGEQESLQGRPFVGRAGKNLDEFLGLSGIDRAELYITNTVKFRPVKRSAAGRTVNRPPTQEEVQLSAPWLTREIELVNPLMVVTLGNTALRALMGPKTSVGGVHGQLMDLGKRQLYPLYHPASLIYNPRLRETYREDVTRLGQLYRQL